MKGTVKKWLKWWIKIMDELKDLKDFKKENEKGKFIYIYYYLK